MSVTVLPLPVRVDPVDTLCTVALRVCRDLGVLRRAQRIRGEALAQERGIPSLLRGPGVNIKPYTPMLDFAGAEGTIATVAAGPVDDIDLTITPTVDGGVRLRLEVNPDVHSAADADAIARRYAGFLSRIAAEPAQPLGRSAALAIRASDDEVTFAHLHARVRSLAAVLEAGGAVAPIDLAYPEKRIAFVLRHADPRLVVTIEGSPAAAHPRALVLDGDGTAGLPAASDDTVFPSPAPDALASVIYTSGSTGTPKGVGVSRGSLSFFLAHHAETLFRPVAARVGRRLRAVHTASFAFDSSWEQLLWLLLGHELLVFDEDDRRDAREIVHSPEMTRESLYVAMTRGRESNRAYIATDEHHLEEHQHREDLQMTARSILYGILQHIGAEQSAHETITTEQDMWRSLAQLAAEYDAIAQEAQQDRWVTLLEYGGLTHEAIDELVETESFGILTTELRRLEAVGHDIDDLLPRITRAGGLDGVEDLGSLLRYRVQKVAATYQPSARRVSLIAGLIPRATGITDPAMQHALHEREQLIQQRLDALTTKAIEQAAPWLESLGDLAPKERNGVVRAVVAYRDRWGVASTSPLGSVPSDDAQRIDYERTRGLLTSHQAEPHDIAPEPPQRSGGRTL